MFLYCYSALIAGLPYKILELLGVELSGWLLLMTPRLLLCCLSFAFDVILYQIVGKQSSHHKAEVRREKQEKALLLFASSWPTLVFLCRPFSNTLESLALALCFAALFLVNPVSDTYWLDFELLKVSGADVLYISIDGCWATSCTCRLFFLEVCWQWDFSRGLHFQCFSFHLAWS